MRGKRICNTLKKVRLDIARANNIDYEVTECKHKGECLGTCPKCEAEVKYLERELEKRRKCGLKIALAGVSAGLVAITASGCDILSPLRPQLMGDMETEIQAGGENGGISGEIGESVSDCTDAIVGEMLPPDDTQDISQTELFPPYGEDSGELILDGDIPYYPDDEETEEYVLEGDIAYFPDSEKLEELTLMGVMPYPEEGTADEAVVNNQDAVENTEK